MKDKVKANIPISKLKLNVPELLAFDQSLDWITIILAELNDQLEEGDVVYSHETPFLKFKGEAIKKQNVNYGDIVILQGDLSAKFITTCITTGAAMMDSIDTEIRSCFIDEAMKKRFQMEDEVSVFVDEGEYDLYFYQNDKIDLYDVFREYVFLNKNPYPVVAKSGDV